jgi:hypothetical protein
VAWPLLYTAYRILNPVWFLACKAPVCLDGGLDGGLAWMGAGMEAWMEAWLLWRVLGWTLIGEGAWMEAWMEILVWVADLQDTYASKIGYIAILRRSQVL